jgi:hypothetical protein
MIICGFGCGELLLVDGQGMATVGIAIEVSEFLVFL